MKNKTGMHVPLIKRAETIAEYLDEGPSTDKIMLTNAADLTEFTLDELKTVLKQTK